MKTFKLLFAFVVSLILFGCETKNVEKHSTEYQINGSSLQIYVIDSCEYIGFVYGTNSDKLTHKGNCRFCTERNKR